MDTRILIHLTTEQARCREVARHYVAMGSIGCFAAALLEALQRRTDQAIIHGNEAELRGCLLELQAVRTPPQAAPGHADRCALVPKMPTLADAVASVGRRMPRLSLGGAA
jgi:hypothetical protein